MNSYGFSILLNHNMIDPSTKSAGNQEDYTPSFVKATFQYPVVNIHIQQRKG